MHKPWRAVSFTMLILQSSWKTVILISFASELQESYNEYKRSRSDWEDTYIKGLDLLGFKYENRSEPFQGASGATHPVLAEAVTQFQALAYKELLPCIKDQLEHRSSVS